MCDYAAFTNTTNTPTCDLLSSVIEDSLQTEGWIEQVLQGKTFDSVLETSAQNLSLPKEAFLEGFSKLCTKYEIEVPDNLLQDDSQAVELLGAIQDKIWVESILNGDLTDNVGSLLDTSADLAESLKTEDLLKDIDSDLSNIASPSITLAHLGGRFSISSLSSVSSTTPLVSYKNSEKEMTGKAIQKRFAQLMDVPNEAQPHKKTASLNMGSKMQDISDPQLYYYMPICDLYKEPEKYSSFDTPDSPENIVLVTNDYGISMVKHANLDKLIQRLTMKNDDTSFQYTLLLTYRSFCSPEELLTKLVDRFNTPPPEDCLNDINKFVKFRDSVLLPMRLRVCKVLKAWIEDHFADFRENTRALQMLKEFINNISHTEKIDLSVTLLKTALAKHQQRKHTFLEQREHSNSLSPKGVQSSSPNQSFLASALNVHKRFSMANATVTVVSEPPKPHLPRRKLLSFNIDKMPLIHWPSQEIARQITLLEFENYSRIRPKELLNQNWSSQNREEKAPNIYNMIQRSNAMNDWVVYEIVKCENLKDRVHALKKMIKIADECRALNNFNAVIEIFGALNSLPVFRLTKTFKALSDKFVKLFEDLKSLVDQTSNFQNLRESVRLANPPCVPYIGIYLTDLTFIDDGNHNNVNGLINFAKRRLVGNVIENIRTLQQTNYNLVVVPQLRELLCELAPHDSEELYQLSLLREPRGTSISK